MRLNKMLLILICCTSCNHINYDRSILITSNELASNGVYEYEILLTNNGSHWHFYTINDTILIVPELRVYKKSEWVSLTPDYFQGNQGVLQPYKKKNYILYSAYDLFEYDSLTFNLGNEEYGVTWQNKNKFK